MEREKERYTRAKKKKGIKAQRVKPSIPAQANDALRGKKEQNEKQTKNKEKETGSRSYDSHGSYGEPILKTPSHWGMVFN